MKCKFLILALCYVPILANAASMGWAIPKSVLQEANVLHVEFSPGVPKDGLPDCANRTYIDITTDAGKMRASVALAAFVSQKEVFANINDGLTTCNWGSSVPNNWIRVRD